MIILENLDPNDFAVYPLRGVVPSLLPTSGGRNGSARERRETAVTPVGLASCVLSSLSPAFPMTSSYAPVLEDTRAHLTSPTL